MNSNIYTNIEVHILILNMNYIHEGHVPSQEKPNWMNHAFSKITRWWNSTKTKIICRSSKHISLVSIFPTSHQFCNSHSVWEIYVNLGEDAQKFLCKNKLLLYYCEKTSEQYPLSSLLYLHNWLYLDVIIYTLKYTCFIVSDLSSSVRVVRNYLF